MTTYYYERISTREQEDKQSFQRQDKSIRAYCKENGIKYDPRNLYKDDKTGSTFNRSDWQELEKRLNEGDVIIFKEISRFTRQADEGFKKYMELINKGVELIFLDNPTVSSGYIKQLTGVAEKQKRVAKKVLKDTIELLILVELDRAEQEREYISTRIKQGIDASDKTQGRKKGQLDKMSKDLEMDIKEYLVNRDVKKIDLMKKHNISRNTLNKYISVIKDRSNK